MAKVDEGRSGDIRGVEGAADDPELVQQIHDHAVQRGRMGELAEAEALLRVVVRAEPSNALAAKNLAVILLARGNYREGPRLYESRLAAPRQQPDPELPFPRWNGEPLERKRVLVWPEQGLGDQIMFARFIRNLQERDCDVTLICHPSLERLFKQNFPVRVLGTSGEIEFPDPDLWLFNHSLLAALVLDETDIPQESYLGAEAISVPFRIGVATRGNPAHANDAHRSLSRSDAAKLLALPGTGSLHPEDTGARDFAETARIIAGLDFVISVDTSIAHLAGAMGKPVWLLLPADGTDWRWQRDRRDSSWYPSARLFRQPTPGDWDSVMQEVRQALP